MVKRLKLETLTTEILEIRPGHSPLDQVGSFLRESTREQVKYRLGSRLLLPCHQKPDGVSTIEPSCYWPDARPRC
jgi:hypothetical protein